MTMTLTATHPGGVPVDPSPAAAKARRVELVEIHLAAGHLVAELSIGPSWVEADHLTTRLIVEAETLSISGAPAPAGHTPAVVRCRELAAAQRKLVIALEAEDDVDVDDGALVRSRALLAELAEVSAADRARLRR